VDLVEPAKQQRRRDVVGEVGDDDARRRREPGRVEPQRVALDEVEPAGMGGGEFAKRREAAPVALDRNDMARPGGEERPRQPAGTGADLDDGGLVERPGGAGDAAGQVEIEEEVLAERFARPDAVPGDDLAQRRQRRDQPDAARLAAMRAARRSAARKLSGRARPRPAIASAVP
jgi:hypothetical protein